MRFCGSSLVLSCLTVSFSCGIPGSVFTRKRNAREWKKEDVRISHQTENPKESVRIRTRYVYNPFVLELEGGVRTLPAERGYSWGRHISRFVLALEGVNSNPSSRERLFLRTANPRQDPAMYKQLRTWLTRSMLPHKKERPRVKKRRRTYISSNGKSKRKCIRTRYVYIPFCSSTRRRCEL